MIMQEYTEKIYTVSIYCKSITGAYALRSIFKKGFFFQIIGTYYLLDTGQV